MSRSNARTSGSDELRGGQKLILEEPAPPRERYKLSSNCTRVLANSAGNDTVAYPKSIAFTALHGSGTTERAMIAAAGCLTIGCSLMERYKKYPATAMKPKPRKPKMNFFMGLTFNAQPRLFLGLGFIAVAGYFLYLSIK